MENVVQQLPLLMGAPASGGQDQLGSTIYMLVMFGLVFVIFYFLIIRPQNKKQKELKKLLESLKPGDKVQTIGGLRGIVEKANEGSETVVVRVGGGATLEFVRSAIASIVGDKPVEDKKTEKADKKEKEEPKTEEKAKEE